MAPPPLTPHANVCVDVEYCSAPDGQFGTDIHPPVALAVVPSTWSAEELAGTLVPFTFATVGLG
jgi:hypothetical protein